MTANADVLFPNILWAQRSDCVLLSIPLQDATSVSVEIREGRVFHFSANAGGRMYGCDLSLFREVSTEESRHVTLPRHVEVYLKKRRENNNNTSSSSSDNNNSSETQAWPRLTLDKTKNPHVQVDWARWKDEDEDEDEEEGAGLGMDYGDLMTQMMSQQRLGDINTTPGTEEMEINNNNNYYDDDSDNENKNSENAKSSKTKNPFYGKGSSSGGGGDVIDSNNDEDFEDLPLLEE